jgi:hypothetical protein
VLANYAALVQRPEFTARELIGAVLQPLEPVADANLIKHGVGVRERPCHDVVDATVRGDSETQRPAIDVAEHISNEFLYGFMIGDVTVVDPKPDDVGPITGG